MQSVSQLMINDSVIQPTTYFSVKVARLYSTGTLCVHRTQSVGAGELAALHAGEPRESEAAARVLGEASRRDGRADEGVRHGHVEPVQLRQQRVQRSRTADQGRQRQAHGSSPEGAES